MRNRITRFWRDERGISTMLVGFGFVGFMGATTLALDIGMNVAARTQAQASADAGALAGAVALVFDDFDDRSATGPAVQSALNASRENDIMGGNVNIGPEDVTFPTGPTGLNNRVHVFVDRDVPTVIGALFGMTSVNIKAAATAEASPANAAQCLLPFIIPDKWDQHVEDGAPTEVWTPESLFDYMDKKKEIINPHDEYRPGLRANGGTGYDVNLDTGTILILKQDNNGKVAPSVYNPWRIPGSEGANDYEEAISGCNTTIVNTDVVVEQEPGMMAGPTRDGVNNLVAQDPGAWWDTGCNCIKGIDPKYGGMSPRLRTIPLYDPIEFEINKQPGMNATFRIISFLGVFIVGMQGNDVIARIHPITALVNGGNSTQSSFAMAIRLVE